jgi:dienelactone hydrolase/Pyruvate/2-oxoacid:ferredoxin oxidoreductase delta subunit
VGEVHWRELYREVVDTGLCTGCAACVMACPRDVLGYTDDFFPVQVGEGMSHDQCVIGDRGCDICTRACPRFRNWESDLDEALFGRPRQADEVYGHVRSILLTRATDRGVHEAGQDGGLVSTLLIWGLETERIDGALTSAIVDGRGPFDAAPALVTDRAGVLATAGYVTLHVDYRNHAASDDDPDLARDLRLGYVVDTVAAGRALQATRDVPVDDERLALLGRSMGGGVGMKALIVEPDLFSAASLWGSVSSLEAEVFRHFLAVDALSPDNPARFHGRPAEAPRFWRGVSARPFFGEVTASVELVHGQVDEVCPPRWAPATLRAMRRAGVDAHLSWYPDRHAFGPSFTEAMRTTVDFIDRELGVDR